MMLLFLSVAGIILSLAIGLCVLGMAVSRLFRWRWILGQGPGVCAVVGLAGNVLFVEVWNLFYPINHTSVLVLGIFTLAFALIFWRTLLDTARTWVQHRSALTIVFLLLLLLLVSLFGLGPSEYIHYGDRRPNPSPSD
jgi:hypothetical protein